VIPELSFHESIEISLARNLGREEKLGKGRETLKELGGPEASNFPCLK
jgi:hypothetical protein